MKRVQVWLKLLTWLLHLTFLTLQISVRPPTSDFWLLTFDFQLPTSDFSLFTTFHFPAQNGLVSCCSSAGIDFLGNRANHDGELDISCYRNILNIRRIVGIPNTTMCSLTETAPLIHGHVYWNLMCEVSRSDKEFKIAIFFRRRSREDGLFRPSTIWTPGTGYRKERNGFVKADV